MNGNEDGRNKHAENVPAEVVVSVSDLGGRRTNKTYMDHALNKTENDSSITSKY